MFKIIGIFKFKRKMPPSNRIFISETFKETGNKLFNKG